MQKNIIIIGNWKMNKTILETQNFFSKFNKIYLQKLSKINKLIKFGFAIPSTSIFFTNKNKINSQMIIAAQNIYQKNFGAYTGELSAKMIKSSGANAIIIGHSERRKYFCETNEIINEKIIIALQNNLLSIVCIGESSEERKNNKWKQSIQKQMDIIFKNIEKKLFSKIIIAYEPIWAIGTGISASPKEAQEVCWFIRSIIEKKSDKSIASKIIIQYGGSVNSENIFNLLIQKDIDGALVGSASLKPESFIKLLLQLQPLEKSNN